MFKWRSVHATDIGTQRRLNEDSVLDCAEKSLWVVADGMGGHDAGDVASQLLVSHLANTHTYPNKYLTALVNHLEAEIASVNTQLRVFATNNCLGVAGSTIVLMTLTESFGVCLWAGDSRLYRLRQGKLKKVTEDHSMVQHMYARGEITLEEMKSHPSKNVITRAIGADETTILDVHVFRPQVDDIYLLCSDGLYNQIDDDTMGHLIQTEPTLEEASNALMRTALDGGADDNITFILVQILDGR